MTARQAHSLRVVGAAPYVEGVARALWPAADAIALCPSTTGTARDGQLSWTCVPSAAHPRLLVPTGSRRRAAAVVSGYAEPTSTRARLRTLALAGAFRTGVADRLLRGRLVVDDVHGGFLSHLEAVLGQRCHVGLHIGPARANRKPVLVVVGEHGQLVGFAKLGHDGLTRGLVRAETSALTALGRSDLPDVQVPRPLWSGEWHGLQVLVQEALPVGARRVDETSDRRVAAMLSVSRSVAAPPGGLGSAGLWTETRSRLSSLESPVAARLTAVARELEEADAAPFPIGAWHGDWHPGNVAYLKDRVLLWDWERFASGVPVGWDELHCFLQRELTAGTDATTAAGQLLAESGRLLGPFAVPPSARRVVAAAYLVHLGVRYLGDDQAGAGSPLGRVETWLVPALEKG